MAAHLEMAEIGTTTVGRMRLGAEVDMFSAEEATALHINMPLVGRTSTTSSHGWEQIDGRGSAALFSPGAYSELHWSADADVVCVKVDAAAVTAELEGLLGHSVRSPVRFDPKLDLSDPASTPWLDAVRLLMRESHREDGLLNYPLIRRRTEQLLVASLLVTQHYNFSDEIATPSSGREGRAVGQALAMINDRPDHPRTTAELATAVGLSARALQSAIVQATGQGPAAHLRSVRMGRAHEDLLRAQVENVTVAAIAHRWGFTHLGRFSIAYRERFGVSPSDTLRLPA